MNAAIYRGAGVVVWGFWPEPTVGPGELLLGLWGCAATRHAVKVFLTGQAP